MVAINSEELQSRQYFDNWEVEKLPGILISSAFIIRKPGYDPECWARWDYRGYRKAFRSYLELLYPDSLACLVPALQVDHLEPKIRFQKGDIYYVRLHLVTRSINAAYGAGFEQKFYQEERRKPLAGIVPMSWFGFYKAVGTPLPGKNAGVRAWQAWVRGEAKKFAFASGEKPANTYAGLLSFLQLAYTGFYGGSESKEFDFEAACEAYHCFDEVN
jgi:hypothetical protein